MVYRSHFSQLQIRYFKLNMERRKLVNPSKKAWHSPFFLLFFYSEKMARKNRKIQNILTKFYAPVNYLVQKIVN